VFHAFITSSQQAFAGSVTLNDRASPAAKEGVAAGWRAGVNLDRAFAVGSVCVKLLKRTIVSAPWVWVLQQICPHFFGG
jgi:hypothetical protein